MLTLRLSWLLLCCLPALALAQTLEATPNGGLQALLDSATDGDIIRLAPGEYRGNFVIRHGISLTTDTPGSAVINAGGQDHALLLLGSNIRIENLKIINWGHDLTAQNAGIYSDKQAGDIIIRHNSLSGDGFGIWLQKGRQLKVLDNRIRGNPELRSADRGNGIQLSTVQDVEVAGNDISQTRDGIYIISSQHNIIRNNTMHDLRYGVHYMYSHSNKVMDNFAYDIRAGYALMSSRLLTVTGNRSLNSEDYGFLMNFITSSTISHNRIKHVWTKAEHKALGREGKGLFVYNSGYNTISYNSIDTAEIGIHLTAGSEHTQVYGNSFSNNPVQVKYVSNREQEWSKDGQGNFWSNYLGWDLNRDGKGDTPFEPNDGIDKLVWQYPEAKVLLDSPAILILRWIQRQFPLLKPAGIKDSFPLMQAPNPISAPTRVEALTAGHN
ncbi:nitrous oxide reductase family maturation protein NosD [Shewanella sp. AS16]|uniref:nitrous oxide reductase family maturation protein NosD n=1 Tax=Shewanella sp. AS16 TaxID=2907625 RepID=UPI001F3836B3|nr:nitrous oxide reductase family maturation protein NosD [Shewanella sp. AS16]MCE9687582.1 nitrous oxide reductase family maturation protein NosD [Shewanella sp. AS16]